VGYSAPNITIQTPTQPTPFNDLVLVDDFVMSASNTYGQLEWGAGSANNHDGTASNPGQVEIVDAGASDNGIYLTAFTGTEPDGVLNFVLGGGSFTVNYVIKLEALSTAGNRYKMIFGLVDKTYSNPITRGVFFTYTDNVNSGRWVINCENASTLTSANTTVAATTNFVNLGFVINSAGTSVDFTIDGVPVGTIATNLPVAGIFPVVTMIFTSGAFPGCLIDLFYLNNRLTVTR
jgi:hypothetical protein